MKPFPISYLSDPEVIGVNLLPEHASVVTEYQGQSTLFSLNGTWDFFRAPHYEERFLTDPLPYHEVQLPRSAELEVPEELIYTNIPYPWDNRAKLRWNTIPSIFTENVSYCPLSLLANVACYGSMASKRQSMSTAMANS